MRPSEEEYRRELEKTFKTFIHSTADEIINSMDCCKCEISVYINGEICYNKTKEEKDDGFDYEIWEYNDALMLDIKGIIFPHLQDFSHINFVNEAISNNEEKVVTIHVDSSSKTITITLRDK